MERNNNYFTVEEYYYDRTVVKLALSSSQQPSTSQNPVVRDHPWYSHPKIGRDRSHVKNHYNSLSDILNSHREEQLAERNSKNKDDNSDNLAIKLINSSKFLLISSDGMWHRRSCSSSPIASPLYLSASQLEEIMSGLTTMDFLFNNTNLEMSSEEGPLIAWVGKFENENYWVVSLENDEVNGESETKEPKAKLESIILELRSSETKENELVLDCKPLREFGDSLHASHDAGILATANGLVEFHKSHGYCSRCGAPMRATKAGACRTCIKKGCGKSVYPRIDSATIMLVTSSCENYALLGRKRSWPSGRYSTLAGFCEVGETLEECCQRETFEESGVVIDPRSIRFAASQPWPFPRSLMVGFRAKAMLSLESSSSSSSSSSLPEIVVDTNEMEDICWFSKDFIKERLELVGSTALTFQPNDEESKFHLSGKASLARYLITEWVNEK